MRISNLKEKFNSYSGDLYLSKLFNRKENNLRIKDNVKELKK